MKTGRVIRSVSGSSMPDKVMMGDRTGESHWFSKASIIRRGIVSYIIGMNGKTKLRITWWSLAELKVSDLIVMLYLRRGLQETPANTFSGDQLFKFSSFLLFCLGWVIF